MTKPPTAHELRGLRAVASGERHVGGLLLGFALIVAVGGLGFFFTPTAPAVPLYGEVTGLGFGMRSRPHAIVRVGERELRVALPSRLCRVGDRISLYRQKTMMGERYRLGPGQVCNRPA